jgi:biotin operon repressor
MQPRPIPDAITGPGHAPGARISVVGYVLDCIKAAIVRRELKPGDMLPSETELSARLGVGKTSIREAVKMLQAVGAVDIRQGHGTVIRTEPGPDMLSPLVFQLLLKEGTSAELLEFRKLLEPNCTLLAQRKATDADIDDLEQMVVRLEERIANGLQTVEDDLAFHRDPEDHPQPLHDRNRRDDPRALPQLDRKVDPRHTASRRLRSPGYFPRLQVGRSGTTSPVGGDELRELDEQPSRPGSRRSLSIASIRCTGDLQSRRQQSLQAVWSA